MNTLPASGLDRDIPAEVIEASGVTAESPVEQIEALGAMKLPHGVLLRRGCRVRVPKHIPWLIPNSTVEALGLYLDNRAYSYASEVIVWPTRAERDRREAEMQRLMKRLAAQEADRAQDQEPGL